MISANMRNVRQVYSLPPARFSALWTEEVRAIQGGVKSPGPPRPGGGTTNRRERQAALTELARVTPVCSKTTHEIVCCRLVLQP